MCKKYVSRENKLCRSCGKDLGGINKFWVNVTRSNGKRITKVVEGISNAKKLEAKYRYQIQKGDDHYLKKSPILKEVWAEYLQSPDIKDKKNKVSFWNTHVDPFLSDNLRMDQLSAADIQEILERMKGRGGRNGNGCSDATRKHVLGIIKRLYNWSKKFDLYSGQNPASKITPPQLNNMVTNYLSRLELIRLKVTLRKWKNVGAALVINFALHTGCRRGEIFDLKWKDVDLANRCIFLRAPKGKPTKLPISSRAYEYLLQAKELNGDFLYVFANAKGEKRKFFNNIWNRVKKKARLSEDFRFHDLRHTYATYMASSGEVSPQILQKLLNHQSAAMTQRYAHLLDGALKKGANVIDDVLWPE